MPSENQYHTVGSYLLQNLPSSSRSNPRSKIWTPKDNPESNQTSATVSYTSRQFSLPFGEDRSQSAVVARTPRRKEECDHHEYASHKFCGLSSKEQKQVICSLPWLVVCTRTSIALLQIYSINTWTITNMSAANEVVIIKLGLWKEGGKMNCCAEWKG